MRAPLEARARLSSALSGPRSLSCSKKKMPRFGAHFSRHLTVSRRERPVIASLDPLGQIGAHEGEPCLPYSHREEEGHCHQKRYAECDEEHLVGRQRDGEGCRADSPY